MKKIFFAAIAAMFVSVFCACGNSSLGMSLQELNDSLLKAETAAEIKELLAEGADANAADVFGTALNRVTYTGDIEAVKILLEAGANPNSLDSINGTTPIFDAWQPEIVKLLIKYGADVNFIKVTGIEHITDYKTDEPILSHGETPLIWQLACSDTEPNEEIIKLLMNAGADQTICDDEGKSAKDYASDELKNLF